MNNNIDSLLDTVSKKLGITPQKLREAMQKGDLSIALQNMPEKDAKKLKSILGNPELIKKMMNNSDTIIPFIISRIDLKMKKMPEKDSGFT